DLADAAIGACRDPLVVFGAVCTRTRCIAVATETGCTVNWSESEEPAEQVVLQSQPSKLHSRDVSLMEQFKIMLRTELDITTKRITTSLSKEIKEISKRTDTLEHRLDDATTVLEGHETEIDSLCYQLQELQDKMEDMENRSHRGNIRIRGFSESYKNLESDITEFFSILVPHLPSSRMEIDRIHRALGRPPQEEYEGHPLQLFADIAPATIAKRRSFKPITTVLQQNNIKYRWAFPFCLHFLHHGKQYSTADLDEATELLQHLHLKQSSPNSEPSRGED
ncbi:hypothetical protein XELAEV_18002959mg, partial [Xenopus laevis]